MSGMIFDYIVVGAGLAGCIMAERLASQRNKKVLIIEKRDHIAGNCYDYRDDNNILIHHYGPHLFHTPYKHVVDYLSAFTEWENYHHRVRAVIDGQSVPLPFNLNTLRTLLPEALAEKLERKLLEQFDFNVKIPILELKQSTDPELQFLADYVYNKVFENYTAKQWGLKPEDMDGAVTARVPVLIGKDDRYFNDMYQMMPKHGYTRMVRNMLDHANIKQMLNTDFHEVCRLEDGKVTFFGQTFEGKVIFTGAIDELFDHRFGPLPYRSVDMRFETVECETYQEAATVNYPNDYDYTRITEFKHIHPTQTPKTTILKEFPRDHIPGVTTPYYPIFTPENQQRYEQYVAFAEQYENIVFVGRLAEYKYYDMDDIVYRALELFEAMPDA